VSPQFRDLQRAIRGEKRKKKEGGGVSLLLIVPPGVPLLWKRKKGGKKKKTTCATELGFKRLEERKEKGGEKEKEKQQTYEEKIKGGTHLCGREEKKEGQKCGDTPPWQRLFGTKRGGKNRVLQKSK